MMLWNKTLQRPLECADPLGIIFEKVTKVEGVWIKISGTGLRFNVTLYGILYDTLLIKDWENTTTSFNGFFNGNHILHYNEVQKELFLRLEFVMALLEINKFREILGEIL